jgi:hypothetical protein
LLTEGSTPSKKRGPEAGLADSEIMTILVLYHSSHFKNFKTFYEGVVLALLRSAFPKAPCYARFIPSSGYSNGFAVGTCVLGMSSSLGVKVPCAT